MEQIVIRVFFWMGLLLNSAIIFPQVIKIYKRKSAKGLSLGAFIGFWFLQVVTFLHAYFTRDVDLMIGMFAALATTGFLVIQIILYEHIKEHKR